MKHLKRFAYGALVLAGFVGLSYVAILLYLKSPIWLILALWAAIMSYAFGAVVDDAITERKRRKDNASN